MKEEIEKDYHNWIINLTAHWCSEHGEFYKLLEKLYSIPFTYTLERDANRAEDGKDFRLQFADENPNYTYRDVYLYLMHPCSVLEMMAALAYKCENTIMIDPDVGDRSGVWFYEMLENMHIAISDEYYDRLTEYIDERIDIMLNRKYEPNGDGGLFLVNDAPVDMRTIEIWYQMNWHLSEIAE